MKSKFAFLNIIILTLIFSCYSSKENQKPHNYSWISFEWVGDTIENKYFDKLAINLPINLSGIPHDFKSQFDLGAPSTMIYGNSIKPYLEKYPALSKKLETSNKTLSTQENVTKIFKNINFNLGPVLFKNKELTLLEKFGTKLTSDSVDTKTVKHIGTVGADLFQGKYLIIDFPNQRMAMIDSLSPLYIKNTSFVNVKLDKGRIKVPVTVNNKVHYFMFDTGSSMFPLMVSKKNLHLFSNPNFAIDTLATSSWGERYDVFEFEIKSTINIGDFKINTENRSIYENPKVVFEQFFEQEGIFGIMGNAMFLNKTIIIDYKNQRFGILNNIK